MINIGNYEDSISLAYYSMYYSALALLRLYGIDSKNHTGTIFILEKIFEINVTDIKKAKKERIIKQYAVDKITNKDENRKIIELSKKWNSRIIIKIKNTTQKEIEDKITLLKNELKQKDEMD